MWLAWSPLLLIKISSIEPTGDVSRIVLVTSSPCSKKRYHATGRLMRFSNITLTWKHRGITMKASGRIRQAISWIIELTWLISVQESSTINHNHGKHTRNHSATHLRHVVKCRDVCAGGSRSSRAGLHLRPRSELSNFFEPNWKNCKTNSYPLVN